MSFLQKLEVKPKDGGQEVDNLQNHDLIPMTPSRRLWNYASYFSFWTVSECSISTWSSGASLLSLGLNVKESIGVIIVGNTIISTLSVLNGGPGYYFHVGYTVCQRLVFGIRGSYFGVAIRTILSIVWYGSQAWLGGQCLGIIFSSWSYSYLHMENTLPLSVHLTTRDLISFLLFQLISIPMLLIRPEKLSMFLHVSSVAVFVAMISVFAWSIGHNGGAGPLLNAQSNFSSKSAHAWAWIYGITSWYGSLSSGITNMSDFTRYSKRKSSCVPGTFGAIMTFGTVMPLFGLLSASATSEIYGQALWMPHMIVEQWIIADYSSRSRVAAFFASLCFLSSQLALNLLSNGIAGGMDMSGLCPKYINIKRGAVLTSLLSWVVQPWLFYNTSSRFVVVMSSFSVFMSPIIAIIMSEFWIIRKRKLKLSDLYSNEVDSIYWYWNGFNLKSFFIFIVVATPGLPGLIHMANPNISINQGILHYYYGNCIFGFCIAFFLNIALNYIFPSKAIHALDSVDYFHTFTNEECLKMGITPAENESDRQSNQSKDVELIQEINVEKNSV
ncbi:Thiamine Metabolism [Scheffersomyces stipitis CBS 6054]|uniref:Thiamine Metabolism n=1 Tax=Scheffersomyces stipitis (strain ATCC 58785 / CBS 6054 / NBRC 10063 / NRRL Y-11545) TaxID=322104 RepID=A3LN50_PICST|nr:Thiamine Metabolism [Scheffersomyces stipitis CBS 6054]ABN64800.2 Thiamine Metabolism [Scheffersomyces stipitis CBS 6054]